MSVQAEMTITQCGECPYFNLVGEDSEGPYGRCAFTFKYTALIVRPDTRVCYTMGQ